MKYCIHRCASCEVSLETRTWSALTTFAVTVLIVVVVWLLGDTINDMDKRIQTLERAANVTTQRSAE